MATQIYRLLAKHLTKILLCDYIIRRAFEVGNIIVFVHFTDRLGEVNVNYGRKGCGGDVCCEALVDGVSHRWIMGEWDGLCVTCMGYMRPGQIM